MLQKNFVIELYFVIQFVKCKITNESKRSTSAFLRNTTSKYYNEIRLYGNILIYNKIDASASTE